MPQPTRVARSSLSSWTCPARILVYSVVVSGEVESLVHLHHRLGKVTRHSSLKPCCTFLSRSRPPARLPTFRLLTRPYSTVDSGPSHAETSLVQSTPPTKPGLQFTERMKGWFSTRVGDSDYHGGCDRGRADDCPLTAELTITVNDLDALLDDPAIRCDLGGAVLAPELSADALTVTNGEFRLFEKDPKQVETWNMSYRMQLTSEEGRRYWFEGVKVLHDDPGFDVWADTTTLLVRILDENDGASGAGILRLGPADLIRQLRTLR
jgi:hypothetical protein